MKKVLSILLLVYILPQNIYASDIIKLNCVAYKITSNGKIVEFNDRKKRAFNFNVRGDLSDIKIKDFSISYNSDGGYEYITANDAIYSETNAKGIDLYKSKSTANLGKDVSGKKKVENYVLFINNKNRKKIKLSVDDSVFFEMECK